MARIHLTIAAISMLLLGCCVWDNCFRHRMSAHLFWRSLEGSAPACCCSLIVGLISNAVFVYPLLKRKLLVSVSAEKIYQRGYVRKLALTWENVQAVVLEPDGISLYGSAHQSKVNLFTYDLWPFELPRVVYIPYHAFASGELRDEFYLLAQRYWQAARFKAISDDGGQVWPPAPYGRGVSD